MSNTGTSERRKSRRRPILETFSIFAVIPKKGIHRLAVSDLSETGIAIEVDNEVLPPETAIQEKEELEILFYLNPTLYLPLWAKTVRHTKNKAVQRVGAEFMERTSKSYRAYCAFLQLLDHLAETAQVSK